MTPTRSLGRRIVVGLLVFWLFPLGRGVEKLARLVERSKPGTAVLVRLAWLVPRGLYIVGYRMLVALA